MPPNMVKPGQEAAWARAKRAAKKQYPDLGESDRFWKIVNHIFQQMKSESSDAELQTLAKAADFPSDGPHARRLAPKRRGGIHTFIRENQDTIDSHIRAKVPNIGKLTHHERRLWVLNDETLYNAWRTSGRAEKSQLAVLMVPGLRLRGGAPEELAKAATLAGRMGLTRSGKMMYGPEHPVYQTGEGRRQWRRRGIEHPKTLARRLSGFGHWSREDHRDAAAAHRGRAKWFEQAWGAKIQDAHKRTFGAAWQPTDYRVSGIGSDAYGEPDKNALRQMAHARTMHLTAAGTHDKAARIATRMGGSKVRKAGEAVFGRLLSAGASWLMGGASTGVQALAVPTTAIGLAANVPSDEDPALVAFRKRQRFYQDQPAELWNETTEDTHMVPKTVVGLVGKARRPTIGYSDRSTLEKSGLGHRHFARVAHEISQIQDEPERAAVLRHFQDRFRRANPRFDSSRFQAAAAGKPSFVTTRTGRQVEQWRDRPGAQRATVTGSRLPVDYASYLGATGETPEFRQKIQAHVQRIAGGGSPTSLRMRLRQRMGAPAKSQQTLQDQLEKARRSRLYVIPKGKTFGRTYTLKPTADRTAVLASLKAAGHTVHENPPNLATLKRWTDQGYGKTPHGCKVEPDGTCPHGQESWLRMMGMI